MTKYTYELFAENPPYSEDVSLFKARIEPPLPVLPEQALEDYHYDGIEVKLYATTESATVYQKDHTREQLNHGERTQQVVSFLNDILVVLNSVEANDPSVWAQGETRLDIQPTGEM